MTTHGGSLPRSLSFRLGPTSADGLRGAIEDIVARQRSAGLDVVNDGELSKPSYLTYVTDRLTGFIDGGAMPMPADLDDYESYRRSVYGDTLRHTMPMCVGPIKYVGLAQLTEDISNLERASAASGATDTFMTAASPGLVALFCENRHYGSDDEYVYALADSLRTEYERIIGAGFMLQLDCPDLALGFHCRRQGRVDDPAKTARRNIEALNFALRDLPAARMRLHVCWGNYEGPHHCDVPLADILPDLMAAKPDGLLVAGANPRHEHEWNVFTRRTLPAHKFLVPGLIDPTTNFIEHPDLVCERIVRLAKVVGRDRIIAGTDCGFSPFAAAPTVDVEIAWAKLRALSDGAALASRMLW